MPVSRRLFTIVFYGDPNGYPPIINCARSLDRAGWRVQIICRDETTHPAVPLGENVSVTRIALASAHRWIEYLNFVAKASRLVSRDAAAVAGHDMHGLIPAAIASKFRSIPLIYHCHDYADRKRDLPAGSALVKQLERVLAPKAWLTVVPDIDRAALIRDELRLRELPLILPNAPLVSSIPETGVLRSTLQESGFDFDKIVFRQGRIGPGHGIEATLESMPLWADARWGYVLMGPADGKYAERLNRRAAELGVESRFIVLPPVGYDQVARFTVDADLGHALYDPINLNHSEMGTASNKVLEYMAAGIPCLVSNTPSMERLVTHYCCGVSVDPSNASAVANAINSILSDESTAKAMGRAGLRAYEAELAYDHHVSKLVKWLGGVR